MHICRSPQVCMWVRKPLQGVLGQRGNRGVAGMREGRGRPGLSWPPGHRPAVRAGAGRGAVNGGGAGGQAFQSPPGPFPRSRAPPGAQWLALVPLPAPRATLGSAAGSEHPKSALYFPAPRPCPSRLREPDTLVLGGRASGWSRDSCSSPLAGALLARGRWAPKGPSWGGGRVAPVWPGA